MPCFYQHPAVPAIIVIPVFLKDISRDKKCEGREQLFPVFVSVKPPGPCTEHFHFVRYYNFDI